MLVANAEGMPSITTRRRRWCKISTMAHLPSAVRNASDDTAL
jgi:hypothetical protein